ncbi:hypothetical protein V492_08519 [Pseudogymnoascus sp. VKM F-4246]|nr:hypothetical protein V492_08519 [Pseudogymnoascus sp. VKM F-4246]
MPPTTRSQARKQSQSQTYITPEGREEDLATIDLVENCATMYPAFVTAPVPTKEHMRTMAALSKSMTDDECRSWMKEHRHPNFAETTFAVLDGDTAKNKTCRVGVADFVKYDSDKMITTDFYGIMYTQVPLEMATISWYNHEEFFLGSGKVLNLKIH